MKIAIDESPLKAGHFLQHRVRGTGFYTENLKRSLQKYYNENSYIFFTRGEKLPKDVDLVHIPYFEPFFLTLPLRKKFKTVVTVHDLTPLVFPEHFPPGIRGWLKLQIQKHSLRNVDAVITDSESSQKDIHRYTGIPGEKIHIVYLAAGEGFKRIQNSEFRIQNLRKKYKLPEKFVLYVGDVTWNKNLPRLIEAAKITDIPLVMVGKALVDKDFDKTNPWNQDLVRVQQIIENDTRKANSKQRIIALGFVPDEDLIALYNMATVYAAPSLYEGFGLPILEAMSCGCSVVTSRDGSIPEVAGGAAFYVDAYSVESIAGGIKKVFEDQKLRDKLSKRGLEETKKFSLRKTADETIKIYKKVAKS